MKQTLSSFSLDMSIVENRVRGEGSQKSKLNGKLQILMSLFEAVSSGSLLLAKVPVLACRNERVQET